MKHRRSKEGWKGWDGWSMHSRMPQATTAFASPSRAESSPHPRQSNSCESKWSGIELPLKPQQLFHIHLEPNNDAELDSPELNKTKDDSERYTLSLDKTQRRPEEKNLKKMWCRHSQHIEAEALLAAFD